MQTCVRTLGPEHWPELYRLMVARRFPATPRRFGEARPYFESARLYGLLEGSELAAGFVFGEPEDGVGFFDVVCRTDAQGMWATPKVVRELFHLAFEVHGLRCLWVQPHNKKALRAALQVGFVPATPLDVSAPVLVMTPRTLPKSLKSETKRRK